MKHGFIKVASAIPSVQVGDVEYNTRHIENLIRLADSKGVEIVVFPELGITGYSCQDLFRQQMLLDATESALRHLLVKTSRFDIISIVGLPVSVGGMLLNCAAVIQHGRLLALIPKTYLPNYNEFYEKRWFASSQDLRATELRYAGQRVVVSPDIQLFRTSEGATFGIEICEDVWAPTPPSNRLALSGAEIIFNLSASDDLIGKHTYLRSLLAQQSARTLSGYVYASCGFGESTQDVVYGGNALIFEDGTQLATSERFSLDEQLITAQIDVERLRSERRYNTTYVNAQRNLKYAIGERPSAITTIDCQARSTEAPFCLERSVDPHPFIPKGDDLDATCGEIFNIQVMGLAKRLVHTHCQRVVLGISGGLDSTLALLVCVKTFDKLGYDRHGIIGVTMPGFGTTDRTYNNAVQLMLELGITLREINISKAVMQHFSDIGHDAAVHDVTYENSQARERTQLLMDLSNKEGALVIGTGDLSELALGWATYNGDHMSMYGVNCSIPKTLIKYLVRYVASTIGGKASDILLDIIDTPISPELIPADENGQISQKTEDLVGPYELHDFFLYYFLRQGFRPAKIFMLAKKAFLASAPAHGSRRHVSGAELGGSYDEATIKKWLVTFLRRFFSQQFKRSCLPDGPKVGSVSLSPRGDWRMPSDATSTIWIKEAEEL